MNSQVNSDLLNCVCHDRVLLLLQAILTTSTYTVRTKKNGHVVQEQFWLWNVLSMCFKIIYKVK